MWCPFKVHLPLLTVPSHVWSTELPKWVKVFPSGEPFILLFLTDHLTSSHLIFRSRPTRQPYWTSLLKRFLSCYFVFLPLLCHLDNTYYNVRCLYLLIYPPPFWSIILFRTLTPFGSVFHQCVCGTHQSVWALLAEWANKYSDLPCSRG